MKNVWTVSDSDRVVAVFSKKKDADRFVRNNVVPQWALWVDRCDFDPPVTECPLGWVAEAHKGWWDGKPYHGTCGKRSIDEGCKDGTTGEWAIAYSLVSLKDAKKKAKKLLEESE